MGRIFLCYKPLHPPTGVEHCCFAHFTHPKDQNLITAHANLLEIYTLHTLSNGEIVSELSASFTIAARIEALNVLPLPIRPDLPDVLVITTRPAKVVLVAYESEAKEIVVLDLFNFEHDALGLGSAVRAEPPPVDRLEGINDSAPTVLDPSMRCAGMLVYGTQLAIIPFHREHLARLVLRILLGTRADMAGKRQHLLPVRLPPRETLVSTLMSVSVHQGRGERKRKREAGGKNDRDGAGGRALVPVAGEGEGHLDLGNGVGEEGDVAGGKEKEKGPERGSDEAEKVRVGRVGKGSGGKEGPRNGQERGDGEEAETEKEDEEEEDEEEDEEEEDEEEEDEEEALSADASAAFDFDPGMGASAAAATAKPYILQLRHQLGVRGVIKDLCFLGGYMQPTVAILHSLPPGWGGTVAARAHCGHVSVVSCAPGGKATPLYHVPLLPHDSFRVLSPPRDPLWSSLLVLSTNALHVIQDGRVRVVAATNGYAATTVATARQPLQKAEETGLAAPVALDGARVAFLDSQVGLLAAGTGELLGLRIETRGGKATAVRVQKLGGGAGSGVFPSQIGVMMGREGGREGLVFLASRTVDSLLLRFELGELTLGEGDGEEEKGAEEEEEGREGREGGRGGRVRILIKAEPGVEEEVEEMEVVREEGVEDRGQEGAGRGGSLGLNGHGRGTTKEGEEDEGEEEKEEKEEEEEEEEEKEEEEEEEFLYGQALGVEDALVEGRAGGRAGRREAGPEDEVQVLLGSRVRLSILDAWPSLGPLLASTLATRVPGSVYTESQLLGPERVAGANEAGSSSLALPAMLEEDGGEGRPAVVKPAQTKTLGGGGAPGMEIMCCGGQGKKGSLVVMRRGLVADTLGRAVLPGPCHGLWVLPSSCPSSPTSGHVLVSFPLQSVLYTYQGARLTAAAQADAQNLCLEAPTLAFAPVGGGRGLVQVYGAPPPPSPAPPLPHHQQKEGRREGGVGAGVRVVWEGRATQEMVLHDEREVGGAGLPVTAGVVTVVIQDPFLVLLLTDGTLRVLRLVEEEEGGEEGGEFTVCEMGERYEGGREGGRGGGREGISRSPITAVSLMRWREGMGLAETRGKRGGKKGKTGRGEEEDEREEEEAKAAMAMARGLEEVGEGEGVEGGEALGEDEEEMILYGAGKEGGDGEEGSEGGREAGADSGDVEAVVEEEGRRGPGAETLGSPNGRREEEEGREVAIEGQGEEVGEEEDEGVVLCALCRADGSLEILLLPRQLPCPGSAEESSSLLPALPRLLYASARCAEGPRLLRNALLFPDMKFRPGKREKAAPGLEGEAQMAAAAYPVVNEMSLALVGPAASLEGGGEGGAEGGAEGGRVAAAARLLERVCLVLWTSEDDLLVYVARPVAGTFLTPPRGGEGGAGGGRAMRPLPWSLLRLSHDLITREPRHALQAPDRPPLHRRLFPFPASPPAVPSSSSNFPFTVGVGHQRGVFVGGLTPAWIINERGSPRVLPAGIRDPYTAVSAPSPAGSSGKTVLPPSLPPHPHVAAFVPFPDAPAGFLVAHNGSQGLACLSLCVANLGGSLGYTAPSGALSGASVTFRRLGPLGHEAKKVVALEGIGTGVPFYAVVVGRGEGERAEEEAEGEGDGGVGEEEEDEEDEERRKLGASKRVGASAQVDVGLTKTGERLTDFTSAKAEYLGGPPLPAVWAGGHQIFIMGGAPFGVTSVIPLEPFERGLALMVYHRRSPSTPAFPPGPPSHQSHFRERYPNRAPPPADLPPFQAADTYLAVGTCTVRAKGEDVPSKGRLLMYRISLDPYAGLTSPPTLTLVDQYSQRSGPPTAIAQLGPHIIIAAGPTLWVYAFSAREKLKPIAFYDADFYVVSLRVVKTLVAVTDAYHSVHLLRWHEHDPAHTLELMGKDYSPIVSAQPGGSHFVVDPPSLGMLVGDSRGNLQLLQYDPADVESRGGNRLVRRADFHLSHRLSFLQHTRMAEVPRPGAYRAGVRVMVFGSVEGGVGALVPVEEKVYRRLYALQAVMVNALPHVGAFNPRGFRLVEARGWAQGRKKGTLDGELLWRFAGLSVGKQEDLASAIGTSREMVLESLLEVDMMTWTL